MMTPLSIFTGPWAMLARWGVISAVVAGFAGYFFLKGDEHGTQKLIDHLNAEALATGKLTALRENIAIVTETRFVPVIKKIYVQGATITKEVPVYVTKTDDAGCVVPRGFVLSFNAAWSGSPAGPASESDRGPSGVDLSRVASAEAGNATSCLAWRAQRNAMIDFYREQQKARTN